MKRIFDILLSFAGIIVLAIPMLIIGIAIKADSPGPVIFRQKRFGRNKSFFTCLKFRSMPESVPHDVPTHLFSEADCLSRFQKNLRKYSLDELPQLFNILRGDMSVVGPRPALWNQDDLIAERDLCGANGVKPGLTGWAQINGRDELPIEVKARLDGEYAEKISFLFDCKCFFGTLLPVIRHEGFVEGAAADDAEREEELVRQ